MKNNSQKSKKHVSSIESKKQHIQDSNGSQEDDDDDHTSNTMAFQVTSKKDVLESVTTDVVTPKTRNSNFDAIVTCDPESDLDSSDGEEPSIEDIQEAY